MNGGKKMSEQELKNEIFDHMKAIRNLCLEYCDGEDCELSLAIYRDIMWINNKYWEEGKKGINFIWFKEDIEEEESDEID